MSLWSRIKDKMPKPGADGGEAGAASAGPPGPPWGVVPSPGVYYTGGPDAGPARVTSLGRSPSFGTMQRAASFGRSPSFGSMGSGGGELHNPGNPLIPDALPKSSGELATTTRGLRGIITVLVTASIDQESTPLMVPPEWTMRDFVEAAKLAAGVGAEVTRLERFCYDKPEEKHVEVANMFDVRNLEYERGDELLVVAAGGPVSPPLALALRMSGAARLLAGGLKAATGDPMAGANMGRRLSTGPTGALWAKLQEKVLDPKRPFYHYSWSESIRQDLWVLMFYTVPALLVGIVISLLPFEKSETKAYQNGMVFIFPGLIIMAIATTWFTYLWICNYFWVALPGKCLPTIMLINAVTNPLIFLLLVNTATVYPLPEGPMVMMSLSMSTTYFLVYLFLPMKLRIKEGFVSDLFASWGILVSLLGIFLLIKLFVVNLADRNVTSLITLAFLYPILVFRGTMDAAKMAEGYNRKSAAVVEAFFTFLCTMFQCIIFLSIPEQGVSGWVIFAIINCMDMLSMIFSGPLAALLRKKNRRMMAEVSSDYDLDHWSSDPLKLKPLLIKVYATVSSKIVFLIMAVIIRMSYNESAYPFIDAAPCQVFDDLVAFTCIEFIFWLLIAVMAESFLRAKDQQFFIRDKKKALMDTAPIMALTGSMITLLLFLSQTYGGGSGDARTDATRLPGGPSSSDTPTSGGHC